MTHYYCENCSGPGLLAVRRPDGRIMDLFSRFEPRRYKAVRSAVCANCKGWLYRLYRY